MKSTHLTPVPVDVNTHPVRPGEARESIRAPFKLRFALSVMFPDTVPPSEIDSLSARAGIRPTICLIGIPAMFDILGGSFHVYISKDLRRYITYVR